MSNQLIQIKENQVIPFVDVKRNDLIKLIGENNITRETSFAIQAVNANDYLSKATPQSVAKCVWNVAITGLSLNPVLKLAYITPRSINGQVEALLMPSYQGMVKLITDTGSVKKIAAHVVYKGDIFEVQYGMNTNIQHTPRFATRKNEDVTHVYAIALLADGSQQFEVMSIEDVYAIRDKSDGYKAFTSGRTKTCIWEDHFGEMCRKTVIKRLCKYLPKSVMNEKWEKVMNAVDLDNKEYPASHEQVGYIERLLENSTYDPTQRKYIESRIESGITIGEAEKLIEDLKFNQLNPVTQGGQISLSDAKEAVATVIN